MSPCSAYLRRLAAHHDAMHELTGEGEGPSTSSGSLPDLAAIQRDLIAPPVLIDPEVACVSRVRQLQQRGHTCQGKQTAPNGGHCSA